MNSCLQCPITAVKTYNNYLLTGQKSRLMVYSISSSNLLTSQKIFSRNSIHRFYEEKPGSYLVIGGKSVRRITLCIKSEDNVSIEFVSDEKVLKGWIWDAMYLTDDQFLLISIHNTVLLWNSKTNDAFPTSSCKEQCILYSARLERFGNEVVVACGTVFNQVLLWKPSLTGEHEYKTVDKQFCGHEGVIFSIQFHPELAQLLSVSDDRSIRLWCIDNEVCLRTFYGHTARVWDAMFAGEHLVSIGEDATCIIWNIDNGSIGKKLKGHKGKSIWSMDINESSIFTGGGDGGIRQWPLNITNSNNMVTKEYSLPEDFRKKNMHLFKDEGFPRSIKFINDSELLIFSNNGLLLKFHTKTNDWCILHEDTSYYTYCVMEYDKGLVALGNLKGKVKLLFEDNPQYVYAEQIFDNGKIFSLSLLDMSKSRYLLACGLDGRMKLFHVDTTIENELYLKIQSSFLLPHSKQRWITDAVLYSPKTPDAEYSDQCYLICGDRRGSIHLYNSSSQNPLHSLLGVHGKTGVTSIKYHKQTLFTTGRDGHFRKYRIDENKIILDDKQKTCKGMDWIEGIWFDEDDIIIYGFYMQSHFAMWSFEKNEIILKVNCGGGYRSWDVKFPQKNDHTMNFTFLKGPSINITASDWSGNEKCQVIKESFHGRETMCAKVLGCLSFQDRDEWLVATSSEDTTINFLAYNEISNSIRLLHTTVGHIGGVKDLVFIPISSPIQHKRNFIDGQIISCGSRTSLKIWDFSSGSDQGSQISCSLVTEIYNPEMNPKQLKLRTGDVIDDMRYLCCDVISLNDGKQLNDGVNQKLFVCACSDGIARVYASKGKDIDLLCILGNKKHCVQIVKFHTINDRLLVFTSATDGTLKGWDITNTKKNYEQILRKRLDGNDNMLKGSRFDHVNKDKHKFHELDVPVFEGKNNICFENRSHQSGINSIDILENDKGIHIVTGGDDNAIQILTLQKEVTEGKDSKLVLIEKKQHGNAHTSSITGVKFLNSSTVVSTSIDQMIKFWNITNLKEPLKTLYTDVADVSNLEIRKNKEKCYFIITGFGIEIFCITINDFL